MTRYKLIVNPVAGRGAGEKALPIVRDTLQRLGVEFDITCTTRPAEAMILAREAMAEGYDVLVALGGDGLAHEIVNGMLMETEGEAVGTLGIIPIGSGNDFVKMLDVPTDLVAACYHLVEGKTRLVDVGRINDHYLVNSMGTGFDALVSIEAQKIGWLTGLPLYLLAVFRTLALTYRTPQATIELDGETISQTITLIAVMNGRCYGGGFWITPDAENDDGLFDLAIARGLGRLEILRLLPDVMKGTHTDKEPVTMARARRVVIHLAEPLPVHADGEILYTDVRHLELEVLPRKLRVIG
ncbi:MAG TPA: diacylglycerol kinase family lipid kinase [Anaerolineae bacterium]|nr:diacylglycerol kinase family lipid kinase [Anaerolineae bacterium]